MTHVLAFDLGASSGRAMLGRLADGKIQLEELHRFPNDPVQAGGRLHWDILRLLHELKQSLLKAKHRGIKLSSIAIDTWGVDFGLLGEGNELLGNPYHYRDPHTNGVMERVLGKVTSDEVFGRTGIQFMSINTIYQIASMKEAGSPLLREAKHFLMIPALLRYFLTGEIHNEFSLATTTQLYNPLTGDWDDQLLEAIGADRSMFGPVVQPGTPVGRLSDEVCAELGIESVPVIAVAEHDTGSAVAAVPALEPSFAYLSCGTWSLIGTEVGEPVIHAKAQELNFTNEGGVYGTYRLLKNIMGLWILQECRREWERSGVSYSFPELVALASAAEPFACFIDSDDDMFLPPGDMPARIRSFCERTGQKAPEGAGAYVRAILESLAFKYRYALEQTESLSGVAYKGLHMVGGGIQNTLLCEWTANAIGKPVWAGPTEGSAIGNMLVQWITNGELGDIWEARRVVSDSFPVAVYEPNEREQWDQAYAAFKAMTGLAY
ncbi:rhamnulokinase family protein [Paenibacillus sp. LHD-117]|uniref:rhamnulokinase n=1 Tax=Paenibacillus sp. LHD-117 TaxID=3071412 RepID=UPI0027E0F869|nr:rhamnulokinase family protein [Paenibacillus sp. LHD-117]MDQ6421805.1 rhamnulokinase family protein [Paenibacillus sp. LHD-117]